MHFHSVQSVCGVLKRERNEGERQENCPFLENKSILTREKKKKKTCLHYILESPPWGEGVLVIEG